EGALQLHPKPFAKLPIVGQSRPDPRNRCFQFDTFLNTVSHFYMQPPGCIIVETWKKGNYKVAYLQGSLKLRLTDHRSKIGLSPMNLEAIQSALQSAGLDGWLFYDHHHRDPIAYRILGLSESLHITRRWLYLIPAHGEPKKLVHRVEQKRLDPLPGSKAVYSTWQELEGQLAVLLENSTRLAMQYSPRNAIMYVSMVDAGTVEVLRSLGKEIVSSADL